MNKNYEELCDLLKEEEKKILKKGDISPTDLESLYRLSAIVTDYETREAMKKEEMKGMGGYSQHYPPMYWMNRMGGNSYGYEQTPRDGMSNDMAMESSHEQWGNSRDYSERRGRDQRTGRYVSRDGSYDGSYGNSYDSSYDNSYDRYSRDSSEHMKSKLQEMMDMAKTDKERNALKQAIERISR